MANISNLQMELLRLYGNNLSEETLHEIKNVLARYFADRASDEMEKVWDDKGLTDNDMIDWANAHDRSENRPRH